MKKSLLLFVVLLMPILLIAKSTQNKPYYDVLILKDSSQFVGNLLTNNSDKQTSIECLDGKMYSFDNTQVDKMEMQGKAQFDVVVLKGNDELSGIIFKRVPNKSISIQTVSGDFVEVRQNDILNIYKLNKENFNYRYMPYTEFGLSFGTPGVLNLHINRWFNEAGIGICGMYLGDTYGIEGSAKYKLYDTYSVQHTLEALIGTSFITYNDNSSYYTVTKSLKWTYFGLAYKLNWGGLHIQLGVSTGSGESKVDNETKKVPDPQLMFQIGYIFRTIR